jgi:hypothetical protein
MRSRMKVQDFHDCAARPLPSRPLFLHRHKNISSRLLFFILFRSETAPRNHVLSEVRKRRKGKQINVKDLHFVQFNWIQ